MHFSMDKKYQYNDGDDIEDYIFSIYKNNPSEQEIEEILVSNNTWAVQYHLSPDRQNLLSWYNFKEKASILEVGAGCGAMTGVFLDKGMEVTAVELTKRRADIIRERYKDRKNLKVYSGNIHEQKLTKKFHYITLIGVLEYAGRFTKGDKPFHTMLEENRTLLKKGGEIVIAIENKLGLKYWRGAPEDHMNRIFESIEGYPNYDGIRTFSRKELKELLENAGFKNIRFYYPLPDYKFCYEIFSDDYLPTATNGITPSLLPSPHPSQSYNLFNEQYVAKSLQDAGIFHEFANSFLVFAKNE